MTPPAVWLFCVGLFVLGWLGVFWAFGISGRVRKGTLPLFWAIENLSSWVGLVVTGAKLQQMITRAQGRAG